MEISPNPFHTHPGYKPTHQRETEEHRGATWGPNSHNITAPTSAALQHQADVRRDCQGSNFQLTYGHKS
ncbi:hypothetical protein HPB52_024872 [Rhipicephalus sanguineus]|uniref:Uncharacterized protein n=1 Tax=Rhipicephalus sanguineus TaxID=34632 RepID=A0A9D4YRS8_RHISA|nr:hypothetical protein HPB52_025665 [Rhipicephalus sanguineus]KAH7986553.1 hypothetical protein HPB52_024872 [Rhipicephalus sanguineus]